MALWLTTIVKSYSDTSALVFITNMVEHRIYNANNKLKFLLQKAGQVPEAATIAWPHEVLEAVRGELGGNSYPAPSNVSSFLTILTTQPFQCPKF